MWQGGRCPAVVVRTRVDAEDHPHVVVVDLDPPHEGADDVALGVPVRRLQPLPDYPGEGLELADDEPEGPGLVGGIAQGRGLALELGAPPPQRREPRLELRLVDEPLGVAVDEAADAAPGVRAPALELLTREPAGPGPRRLRPSPAGRAAAGGGP